MSSSILRRSMVVLPVAFAALVLAGCTAAPSDSEDTAANDAAAVKFVACLTDQAQTAKIVDSGQVGVLLPDGVGPDSGPGGGGSLTSRTPPKGDAGGAPSFVAVTQDADGTWMSADSADGYPEEGGIRDAWTACETTVPDFVQPAPDIKGGDVHTVTRDDMIKASLAFADCARDNNYADFADPDADGQLLFPSGMTEDEFRSLLEACSSTLDGVGFPLSSDSASAFDFDWMAVVEELGIGMGGKTGPTGGSN
jgi:hypothetical protein